MGKLVTYGVTVMVLFLLRTIGLSSSIPPGNWRIEVDNLSLTLRVELFSFANGNRFLTASANSTNASVTNAERTIALTVATMLQRLPIMVTVNKTMELAITRIRAECLSTGCNISETLMRSYLRALDNEFETDNRLSDTYLPAKSAISLIVKQLRVGTFVPYDPENDLNKNLQEWSKDPVIRSFLAANMLPNYCALFERLLKEPITVFAEALTILSRDGGVDVDQKTGNIYTKALSEATAVSLNRSIREDDFQHTNFFWYNHVANQTMIRILDDEIRGDNKLHAEFDAIRGKLSEIEIYGFRIQSLLFLVASTSVCAVLWIVLWNLGRFIYKKYRSRYAAQPDDYEPIEVELPDD